jgi:hypothetical protein
VVMAFQANLYGDKKKRPRPFAPHDFLPVREGVKRPANDPKVQRAKMAAFFGPGERLRRQAEESGRR